MEEQGYWSYTMDYNTNEILIKVGLENGKRIQIRATEKDIDNMKSWFELNRHMEKNKK